MKPFSFNLVLLWVRGSREYKKQQVQTCEGWNLSMVLMMQFLLESLSPGPGLHGVRNFKTHYLFFSEEPTTLHRVHQTSPQFRWEKLKCRTESRLMHSPSPRYKPRSSWTFLCIFMLWFSSLVTLARAIFWWAVPLADHREGPGGLTLSGESSPREASVPITPV